MKSSMTRSGIEPVDHNASTTRAIQAAHHWRNLVREKQEQDQNKEEDPIRCGRSRAPGGRIACVQERFTDGGADCEAMIDAANSNRQKLMIAYLLHFEKANLEADPVGQKRQARKCANLIGEKVSTRKFAKRDQFAAELIHFSNCVLENKEPEPSGLEGLSDVRIVRAIHKAAQTGKMIELGDFSFKKKPTMRQEIDRPAHGKPKTVNAESPSGE